MTLIAIVAHPRRTEQAVELAHAVDGHLVWDVEDPPISGCELNHMRALRWHLRHHSSPDDWCVVLEDDAVPCADFRPQLDAVLTVAPAPLVSLYLGTGYPIQWQHILRRSLDPIGRDPNFLVLPELLSAVGYAVRATHLDDLARYLQGHAHFMGTDQIITRYCRDWKLSVAYARPSIVNHRDGDPLARRFDTAGRHAPRRAWKFGARSRWTNTFDTIEAPKVVRVDADGIWYEIEQRGRPCQES